MANEFQSVVLGFLFPPSTFHFPQNPIERDTLMASFAKALKYLEGLQNEIAALASDYDSPQLAAVLKALGGGRSAKPGRAKFAPSSGGVKVARYASDQIHKVLDAVASYVKTHKPSVSAFQQYAKIPPNVAKSLVQLGEFPGNPRTKTVEAVALALGVKITLAGAPVTTPPPVAVVEESNETKKARRKKA